MSHDLVRFLDQPLRRKSLRGKPLEETPASRGNEICGSDQQTITAAQNSIRSRCIRSRQ
ncbi:hypothetical protein JXA40_09505 [bacterium]|nr:hypothetical protein [candidate division CSSED10-310 bacterium]